MNVIIFGFKGCGKTHFGKLLAKKLAWSQIDTDDLIIQLHGNKNCTARDVYKEIGPAKFRALETQAILSLNDVHNSVISLGGGAILDPQNVIILQEIGTMIYLETSLETIRKRGINHVDGPIDQLFYQRLPIYRAINAHKINTDQLNEQEVIATLENLAHGF